MLPVCEKCGASVRRVISHGEAGALWCSNCVAEATPINPAVFMRHDDIPGGLTLENYGPVPITVYSHTERRVIMEQRGLRELEKFCPTPGTDIDPAGIPNPKGYMDAQTLANARELICRNGGTSEEDVDTSKILVNLTSGTMTPEEARKHGG